MKVLLFKGRGFVSNLIRWQQRSEYTHAAVLDELTNLVYESREFKGVRCLTLHEATLNQQVDVFDCPLTEPASAMLRSFLEEQVGKGYDYTMVARFLSRRQESRSSSGKWFCSELVAAAFTKVGMDLLLRIPPCNISPGLLSYSPRLEYVRSIAILP